MLQQLDRVAVDPELLGVNIQSKQTIAIRADVDRAGTVLRENLALAAARGADLHSLNDKAVELVLLSKRFHMLGRKLSEEEKRKMAATFLQAMVRGFLARLLRRSGGYLMRIYIKTLRHDPAEESEKDHDFYEPVERAYTVSTTS